MLTHSHVVQGAKRAEVTRVGGRSLSARVLGDDRDTDLALIRIDENATFAAARLGDSKKLKPGEIAIAIGNPLGFDASVGAPISALALERLPCRAGLRCGSDCKRGEPR